ncbi:hypothetical protein [Alicyclobacillus mengziensis]|uniref:DUF1641 domain-containing protein n=1 Tax=Alicyclobacillus mengziensis TaxID=2931921 RepID=A0A9X7VV53_9BACL|nr:hypothetical protein [Alicyclobacillus mengziensis]QSO45475.1 hypothetical protein JZ786_12910 [Alicyclobacillus mengziensis]
MTDSSRTQIESKDILDLVVQPEIKEFLITAIQMVPKITNIMKASSKMIDLAEAFLQDDELLESLEAAIKAKTDPIQDTIEDGISLLKEAQERAELDTSNIGILGMYKMLKDPVTQDKLRFMKALLATISEHQERELH